MTLLEAVNEFVLSHGGVSAVQTQAHYRKMLKPLAQEVPIAESLGVLKNEWHTLCTRQNKRKPQPLSQFTLDKTFRAWNALFNWCVRQEYLAANPMRKLRRVSPPNNPPKAIETDNLKAVLVEFEAHPRDYALVRFLASTGCRVGGLCGVRLDDLRIDKRECDVTEKGRGGGKLRTVFFDVETERALRRYLEVRGLGAEFLFLGESGKPLTEHGVRMLLRRVSQRLNIRRVSPHQLRHWFARNWLNNGGDISSLSAIMGHQSTQVTLQFYARWLPSELKDKHERFARMGEG